MDCADIPRTVAQSSDPNFAQDNPRIVAIRTLRITDILHDVTNLDGAIVVSFLKPLAAKTFHNYAQNVFVPYVKVSCEVSVEWTLSGTGTLRTA